MAETHQFDASRLFGVQGMTALVTGGGTGIGLMATQALAANGAKVYITGRRMDALENAAQSHSPQHKNDGSGSGQIIPIGPCDVTSKDDLQRLASDLATKEPYISLLFCNAGKPGPKAPPEHDEAESLRDQLWNHENFDGWRSVLDTNMTSMYFTTVAFLPLLQAATQSKGGPLEAYAPSVITTSSMSGLMRHAQGHFSYNAAKGGAVHLTKLMSAEFQKTGIRVNSIAPGYFPSEQTVKTSDDRQKSHLPDEKVQEKGHVPMMRPGREEEMAMTVLFLAKNQYVNGEIVAVDGGVLNVLAGR